MSWLKAIFEFLGKLLEFVSTTSEQSKIADVESANAELRRRLREKEMELVGAALARPKVVAGGARPLPCTEGAPSVADPASGPCAPWVVAVRSLRLFNGASAGRILKNRLRSCRNRPAWV